MTRQAVDPDFTATIRLAVPADATELRTLRLEALSRHPEAFAADYEMTAAEGPEIWAQRLQEYAAENSSAVCIAEVDHRLVGMAGISRGHWPKTRHSAILWGVYVQQAWRGRRIGQQLVNDCLEWARSQSITIVRLGVTVSNTSAIRCYAGCGFTVYGLEQKSLFYHLAYYDELMMSRML
jgi:ribosomal protein S18 acetylase RimI-like enzyme